MTEKQYCYILEKYSFYEDSDILMVSVSCDEIITRFISESINLSNKYGLIVTRYEFGKFYDNIKDRAKSIRWIEKKDGKIIDLKGDV